MSFIGFKQATKGKRPISEKIIRGALYAVIAGALAFVLSEPTDKWLESLGISLQRELIVTLLFIFIAIIITTGLLGHMSRFYVRRGLNG